MRWPEVSTAILHSKGMVEKIIYLKDWEYDSNLILVVTTDGTEIPLPEYMKTIAKHKFYKDEFLFGLEYTVEKFSKSCSFLF